MGLFGKKKSKASKEQASSYSPPDVVSSSTEVEAVVPGEDGVMVSGNGSVTSLGSDDSKKEYLIDGEEEIESNTTDQIMEFVNKTKATAISYKDKGMEQITVISATVLAWWFSLSKVTQVALLAGAAIGAVTIVVAAAAGGRSPAFPSHINVAFAGNSYFYANDLPRFVESIGNGHVTQDSVVHNSASILELVMTGNGMWNKWSTQNGMINGAKFDTYRGTTEYLYDMGACSVPQLLTGSDQMITPGNQLGAFVNDGQNPCFQQDAYREYKDSVTLKHGWDFVVITDQPKAMAFDESRHDALMAFNYTYGPILKKKHISPIIVQPHAYSSSGVNSASTNDLATFTALIMEGAQIYRKYLNKRIGLFAKAHVAPVGNAYLAIYEESPNDLWPKLFLDDGVHPSAYGTFVYGCVIYATMTGYMPKYKRVVVDDMENSALFASARRVQSANSAAGFPTKDEAATLYKIVKKVAISGYKPKALRGFKIQEDAADFLDSTSSNVYDGSYASGNSYASNNVYNEYDSYNQYNGYQNNAVNNNDYNVNNQYDNYQYDNYQENNGYNNNANGNYQENNGYDNNENYNGDYNNGNNYQVNNNYEDYQENANGNYNNANQQNMDADADANENNNNGQYEAAQQYYNARSYQNHNSNNVNGQYGGGNQNKQFYYNDLKDNDGN
ncbi:unnamed protein product [Pseudo-nitzschia multistriata]|uniref:Uncharacterized protein n=1 Tax=Pseudo-nitzschia multistriata TaxID=183589 RepID=A0A448YV01_9STRA|nr:unnamed protein product [Pseudo-nitzschia multistriata]